ncbi:adhesion G-protein coupled receptor G2-like [Antedon mediterranea]|uniref:adhesion G-protein coupled receptor G2-like n=1 Tax=Antedon mediterranea TaxID=105859 RepID=UPI003AF888D2
MTYLGKPTAEIQLLFQSQSINLQSKVTFQCTVKYSVDWRWYKDDIELSSETRNLKNLTINEVVLGNQGYYYCKAFGVSPHDDVTDTSMRAVLVVTDAFTVPVSVSFLNLQFTSVLTDSSSEEFKNTSTIIVNLLTESISISDIFVQVLRLSAGSVIADINIHTPSADTTYDNFMNSLSEDFNISANNGKIGNFSIFSTENCSKDIIEGLTFGSSAVGQNVSSEEVCPQSAVEYGMSLGFSICFSDGLSPAMWQEVMHRNCSEATSDQLLERLNMMPITEENAEEVLQAVNNITTTEPDTITPDGLEATAEIIESVISVNSKSAEVTSTLVDTVASLFEVDDDVLFESQMETQAPSRIVESLEEQLAVVDLENETYVFITNTVAVQAQSLKSNELDNMGIGIASYQSADSSVIVNLTGFIEPEELDNSASVASVSIYIPAIDILASSDGANLRVVTVVYNDSSLFPTNQFDTDIRRPNGQVISTSIPGVELKNLSDPIITTFIPAEISENNNETECVFWDFELDDGNGGWSGTGCYFANGSLDGSNRQICHCDHLTNFAILMNFYSSDTTSDPGIPIVIARYITNIGLGVSIACLLATIFTFTTNRKLRNSKPQQILCHLCVSLLGLYLIFLVGIDRTKKRRACTVIAGLIHYFLLTSIFWMSVQAIHMYYLFVKVYDTHISRFFFKACLFAWGLPVVIVAVTVGIDVENYANTDYCFLAVTRMYYGVALPIAVTLLTNVVVFVMVLHSLSKLGNVAKQAHKIRKKRKGMYLLQNAVCISAVMGMTWLIGFFAIGSASEIVQLLFCILNSFQGFFIFVMYCFRSKDIRRFWADKTFKKCYAMSSSFIGAKNSNLYSSGGKSTGFNSSASGRNQTHSDSRNYSNSNQVSFARSSRVSNDFSYRT